MQCRHAIEGDPKRTILGELIIAVMLAKIAIIVHDQRHIDVNRVVHLDSQGGSAV
jgi:hypothetical protein